MSTIISFPGINEGVKNPFRWFLSYKKRNAQRRVCKGMCKYKLFSPSSALLPFQVYAEFDQPYNITWNIYNVNEEVVFSPNPNLLTRLKVNNITYVYYKGGDIGFLMPQGFYTSEITLDAGSGNVVTWYSEEFYSLGYCSQGEEQIADPNLCSLGSLQSGEGSGPYTHDDRECTICNEAENALPVYLLWPGVLPIQTGIYKIVIKIQDMSPTAQVLIDVGGGDQIVIMSPGTYVYYVYSALEVDLVVTLQTLALDTAFMACLKYLSVEPLLEQELEDCHMQLKWWGDCGLVGEIYYGDSGYQNSFWLEEECEVIKAEPRIYIEATENGDKELIPQFQKRSTSYQIELGAHPAYVLEALAEMILHKNIQLKLTEDLGVSFIKNVTLRNDPAEELGGCLGLITMTFELDDITAVDGCCDEPIEEALCIEEDVILDGHFEEILPMSCFNISTTTGWTPSGGGYCTSGTDPLSLAYISCFGDGFYRVTVVAVNVVAGNLEVTFDGVVIDSITADGTYNYDYDPGEISTPSPTLLLTPQGGWNGCVSVGLYILIPDWYMDTAESGWQYDAGLKKVCFADTTDEFYSSGAGAILAGSYYKITVSVTVASGGVSMVVGGHTEHWTVSGIYTFSFLATVDGEAYFVPDDVDSAGCINYLESCRTESTTPCEGTPEAGIASQEEIICEGTSATFTAVGSSDGPGITYQWQVSNDNVNFADVVSGTGGQTLTYISGSLSGDKWFRLKVTCSNSAEVVYSNTVQVAYDPLSLSVSSNSPCEGGTLLLSSSILGGGGAVSIEWSGPNGFSAFTFNPSIPSVTLLAAGTYTITALDDYGCTLIETLEVVIHENPVLTLDSVVDTTGGNDNGEIHVSAAGGTGPYTYFLTPAALSNGTGDFTALPAGTYDALVTDANLCTDQITGIVVA